MSNDELFMQRALELAASGIGQVSPNPCVGCVITSNGVIIGEGWHQQYGGPHAEVNAVRSVADPTLLEKATVYVNLEPCAHHGKTPPCAPMLIGHKVSRVVIANVDTNPLVGGKGIEQLREAGIEVDTGVLENEGRMLNKRFFTFMEKHRPFVVLKWAQTADRFIARPDFSSKWISNEYARQLVHRWRSEEAAVMVGTTTAAADDPTLNVRDWSGRNPVRIVIDRHSKLNSSLKLFDRTQPTLCYTLNREEEFENLSFIRLPQENFIPALLADLHKRKTLSVMVEGGAQTLNSFIAKSLWDEARIFTSRNSFGEGIEAPLLRSTLVSREDVMGDLLEIFSATKI